MIVFIMNPYFELALLFKILMVRALGDLDIDLGIKIRGLTCRVWMIGDHLIGNSDFW